MYQLFLYPYWLSPFRHVPGPPLGNPVVGQFGNIIRGEAGIVQREWSKQYGPVVRAVGPIGIERLMFTYEHPYKPGHPIDRRINLQKTRSNAKDPS